MLAITVNNLASPALDDLVNRLRRPGAFFKTTGKRVEQTAKNAALARSKGGKFWRHVADLTRLTLASDTGAVVECLDPAGVHRHFGGVIRPVNAKALTIPLPAARGKRAAEWTQTLFVLPGSNGLLGYAKGGRRGKGEFVGLYWLRASATQKPQPWWPDGETITALAIEEATWWLDRQTAAAGGKA